MNRWAILGSPRGRETDTPMRGASDLTWIRQILARVLVGGCFGRCRVGFGICNLLIRAMRAIRARLKSNQVKASQAVSCQQESEPTQAGRSVRPRQLKAGQGSSRLVKPDQGESRASTEMQVDRIRSSSINPDQARSRLWGRGRGQMELRHCHPLRAHTLVGQVSRLSARAPANIHEGETPRGDSRDGCPTSGAPQFHLEPRPRRRDKSRGRLPNSMNLFEELQWRHLVQDCTDAGELTKRLVAGPLTVYAGFDPTADSLHVGSLIPLLGLRRFQLAGHHPIALAGGSTGSIGDPSGKSAERQLLTREVLDANVAAIKPQLARLLDFETKTNPARLVDNADWTRPVSYLEFLRDIGKHFSVNVMVAKESIRARMEDREAGISYTEFSYMLLQAFDFLHLCREFNCELQSGGSDQWGNITAGIDLCRKKLGRHVFGLTHPLVTKADGTKFGKSESGNVWLDPRRTSVYKFYQFWINTE